ncbi:hypothetical protein RJ639_022994 [Escallonia herrerae]|uniref:Rho-GAP domain-containing protein n=1 Tax=Escallonia herrerae TaxID=1293975 RepID=A0AA88V3A8_9ASTE|nr:hypothetical protein RJ639_022994 [Escallonia herrerae]
MVGSSLLSLPSVSILFPLFSLFHGTNPPLPSILPDRCRPAALRNPLPPPSSSSSTATDLDDFIFYFFASSLVPWRIHSTAPFLVHQLKVSPEYGHMCLAKMASNKCVTQIDRKEARVNAMRSAILETFPEPNRRLLQRILKMMHTISLHASENRMTPSAVAACMAPLLLRPLLAGECELEDDFDMNGDSSAQLLAAANAANNAQAIITTLLEEYENIFDEDAMHRCSISADSQIENSGSEDSSEDENLE